MKNKWKRNQYNTNREVYEKTSKRINSDESFTIGDYIRYYNGSTSFISRISNIKYANSQYDIFSPDGSTIQCDISTIKKIEVISDYDNYKYKIGQMVLYKNSITSWDVWKSNGPICAIYHRQDGVIEYLIGQDASINDVYIGRLVEENLIDNFFEKCSSGNKFQIDEQVRLYNNRQQNYLVKNIFKCGDIIHYELYTEHQSFDYAKYNISTLIEESKILKMPVRIYSELDPYGEEDWES